MSFLRTIKDKLSVFLLIALLALMANNMVYRHSHRLADGRIIWHAHPFKSQKNSTFPITSHTHTAGEFLMLDLISNPVFLITGLLLGFIFTLTFLLKKDIIFQNGWQPCFFVFFSFSHRGPPVSAY